MKVGMWRRTQLPVPGHQAVSAVPGGSGGGRRPRTGRGSSGRSPRKATPQSRRLAPTTTMMTHTGPYSTNPILIPQSVHEYLSVNTVSCAQSDFLGSSTNQKVSSRKDLCTEMLRRRDGCLMFLLCRSLRESEGAKCTALTAGHSACSAKCAKHLTICAEFGEDEAVIGRRLMSDCASTEAVPFHATGWAY